MILFVGPGMFDGIANLMLIGFIAVIICVLGVIGGIGYWALSDGDIIEADRKPSVTYEIHITPTSTDTTWIYNFDQ